MCTKIFCPGFLVALLLLISFTAAAETTVFPSGDLTGNTDQVNIKAALEAEKNGGAVLLAEGTFYANKSVVVLDFAGTFKGAGKTLTTVRTAPGVDFDISPSLDAIAGFPPARGLLTSMFMFTHEPSTTKKTFDMSDLRIVVDRPAVDPPLDGFVDDRRAYLLNTMAAVIVVNTDAFNFFAGQPFGTTNLDVAVEDVVIEGIQDPVFRGFFDLFPFDTDNSMFDGLLVGGPNSGDVVASNLHVTNADFGINISENGEALISNCVIQNAALGIENFTNPTTALDNLILDASRSSIVLLFTPNSLIEGNHISTDDSVVPIAAAESPNVEIRDNFVSGNFVYGINPFFGSDRCTISNNLLVDMSSLFGAVSLELNDNCSVENNTFVNVESPFGFGAVWVSGKGNKIENNDYTHSGLAGWASGNGAVLLDPNSAGNKVSESLFPIVGGVQTTMCDQVLDLSGTGQNAQGKNAVLGYGVCNNNPELAEHIRQVIEQRQSHTLDMFASWR